VLAFGHGNENAKLLKGHAGNSFPSPKPPLIPNKRDLTIENNLSLSAAALLPGGLACVEFNRFCRLKRHKLLVGSITSQASSSLASKPDEGNDE
jgi:hypothetical protein